MVVDHRIGQWDQQAIAAIAALDARFITDTGAPLVGAGRGIAPAKQTAEQRHLVSRGKAGWFWFSSRSGDWLWRQSPLNAVGFEQHNQAGIFGLEGFELQGLSTSWPFIPSAPQ